MIRIPLFCWLLFFSSMASAQRELINTRDPATLRSEEINITHITLPAICTPYAGLSVLDIRPVQSICGFIRPSVKEPARRMSASPSLSVQLNNSIKIRSDSARLKDSLLVILKSFWLFRSLANDGEMFCRVHAIFFIRRQDSVIYWGKLDTLLSRRAVIRHEFRDLPALFFEDLLSLLPRQANPPQQYLSYQTLVQQAADWIRLPMVSSLDNGLLLSYPDFVKGRHISADITLRMFDEQYQLLFDREDMQHRYAGKLWGVLYKGELYIRQGRHYSKAYPLERSYFTLNNIRNDAGAYLYSYPLLLNLENGKLE